MFKLLQLGFSKSELCEHNTALPDSPNLMSSAEHKSHLPADKPFAVKAMWVLLAVYFLISNLKKKIHQYLHLHTKYTFFHTLNI